MADNNELVVALDGITVQHAAELLFDTAVDSTVRAQCPDAYLQSLGDLVFALLCGHRFATSARIPTSPNRPDRPAAEIIKDAFKDRLIPVGGIPTPEDILNDPTRLRLLKKDLEYLVPALDLKRVAWEDFIRRETALYLGNDDTLRRQLAGSQYVFGGTHYTSRRQLLAMVPEAFILALMPCVKSTAPRLISDAAMREFITRVAVTHLLFYWDNEASAEPILASGGVRLPHETRALLRYVQMKGELPKAVLKRAVAPHALKYVLSKSETRADVVSRLQDLYYVRLFRDVRSVLCDTVVESDHGDTKSVQTLLDDMERLTTESNRPYEHLAIKGMVPATVRVGAALKTGVDFVLNRRRYIMRQLVKPGRDLELREMAAKVFREFRSG